MDVTPTRPIFAPVFPAILQVLGMDLAHFGVMMMLILCRGTCAPPMGPAFFAGASMEGVPVWRTMRPILPSRLTFALRPAIVTPVPDAGRFAPRVMPGNGA